MMSEIQIMGKIAFTAIFASWVFMAGCRAFDFEPSFRVKSVAVAVLLSGVTLGVLSIIAYVWSL